MDRILACLRPPGHGAPGHHGPRAPDPRAFVGERAGFFVYPSYSIQLKKHYPSIGLIVGSHHTLNSIGYGFNLDDRYFPNERQNKFNLFFICSFQLITFNKLSSPSIKNILVAQLSGGYGVEFKFNHNIRVYTYFCIGLLVEKRKFIQNIDSFKNFDAAGIPSVGISYTLKQ